MKIGGNDNPLFLAIEKGNLKDVKKEYPEHEKYINKSGQNALHVAILTKNTSEKIIEFLIEHANFYHINKQDNYYGFTPIILATMMENVSLVKLLMDKGADPTIQDATGSNAFDYVLAEKQTKKQKEINSKLNTFKNKNKTKKLFGKKQVKIGPTIEPAKIHEIYTTKTVSPDKLVSKYPSPLKPISPITSKTKQKLELAKKNIDLFRKKTVSLKPKQKMSQLKKITRKIFPRINKQYDFETGFASEEKGKLSPETGFHFSSDDSNNSKSSSTRSPYEIESMNKLLDKSLSKGTK